ncbi:MAG TPA: hypothetical protein VMF67_12650 [Rhizomicrobium sp.]|nr:hypothetical protein [Rhizomicrobium sp.]
MKDPFLEAQRLADSADAWQEPGRCDAWISIMKAIAANESERPEARAEAELLVKRLRKAKRKPAGAPVARK